MLDKYFVRFRGRVLGPMSADKMKQLIQRGQVTRMHELSADGIQWSKADAFPELFPARKNPGIENLEVEDTSLSDETIGHAEPAPQEWYAHVNDTREGPVNEETLQEWIRIGSVTSETLVWKTGMDEWSPAASCFPQFFPAKSTLSKRRDSATAKPVRDELPLVDELRRRRTWVYVLAVTSIVLASINLVAVIIAFVRQVVAPVPSGADAVVGILSSMMGMVLAVMTFVAFLSLLQFANSLSVLQFAPTEENILRSLKKLSSFWLLAGISVLIVLVLICLLLLLASAVGASFSRYY